MVSTRLIPLAIAIGCALLTGPVHAGGLYLGTFATPSMGTAGAGVNAIAMDASTAFNNPAGMTRLDDHHLMLGLAPGFSSIEFDADSSTPTPGGDGGKQGGFIPMMTASYVHKISDRWRFGMSLLSISGAALDPSDGWTGRNEITEVSIFTLSLLPSVAVRVTDWLSVGAGVAITYGKLDLKLRAASLPGEPTIKLKDMTDWAAAPLVSVLLQPTERLRIGVVYQGETELHLNGKVKIPVGVTPNIELDLNLAQAVRTSVYWEVNDTVALMMNAGWEDWSTAKSLPISVAGMSAAYPLEFRDTWYLGGGIHYRVSEKWLLQTGFRYDSSALKDSDRTTAFPVDQVLTYGIGAKYDKSEKLQVGVHFAYSDLGKSPVDSAFVKGEYEHNDLFLFGMTLNWKKLPWSGRGTF